MTPAALEQQAARWIKRRDELIQFRNTMLENHGVPMSMKPEHFVNDCAPAHLQDEIRRQLAQRGD